MPPLGLTLERLIVRLAAKEGRQPGDECQDRASPFLRTSTCELADELSQERTDFAQPPAPSSPRDFWKTAARLPVASPRLVAEIPI